MPTLAPEKPKTVKKAELNWTTAPKAFLPLSFEIFADNPVEIYDWTEPQKGQLRIFKSDFLEALTLVHPVTPILIYLPLTAWFIYTGAASGLSSGAMAALYASGVFFWSFFEYAMHRLVFHFPPKNKWEVLLSYFMHGIHHAFPEDDRRLVMPPFPMMLAASMKNGMARRANPSTPANILWGRISRGTEEKK